MSGLEICEFSDSRSNATFLAPGGGWELGLGMDEVGGGSGEGPRGFLVKPVETLWLACEWL